MFISFITFLACSKFELSEESPLTNDDVGCDSGTTDTDTASTDTADTATDSGDSAEDTDCGPTERRLHDVDGDGYGDPNNYIDSCVDATWEYGYVNWIDGRDDCNDNDASVHPDAEETCSNEVDDNCDGEVDEACDTSTDACAFTVSTWDGDLTMGNELTITLNSASPSGASVPGTVDVLTLDFTAVHTACSDILITGFTVEGIWSDNAGTGWYPTWVGTTIGGVLVDGTTMTVPPGRTGYASIHEAIVVPAGETVTVEFSANMSDADATTDDTAQFNFYSGGIEVYDGNIVTTLRKDRVSGMSLVF